MVAWREPNGLNYIQHPGISLRDQLAFEYYKAAISPDSPKVRFTAATLASDSYEYADAMLAEREKNGPV